MKIGIVLPRTPGYSETFFRSKIKGLTSKGFEVILFVSSSDSKFDLCPVVKSLQKPKSWYALPYWWVLFSIKLIGSFRRNYRFVKLDMKDDKRLKTILRDLYFNAHILSRKLDWLHFGFATMALGKENVAQSIGSKMAVSFRGYDIGVYPIKNPGCYDLLWKKLDKVHTISNDLLAKAYDLGLSDQVPYQKITPAIDPDFFQLEKNRHNHGTGVIRFLTVARLHWKKGLDYTLKAMEILRRAGIDFRYRIVGDGPDREYLTFLTHQLGLTAHVEFLGSLNPRDVRGEYEKADFYIQYSVQEGFCNSVLEAQSMGLLSFVSDAEGLSENVLNNQTGWVIPSRSPKLLASKVIEALETHNDILKKNRLGARERVIEEFNIKSQIDQFEHFYAGNEIEIRK